MDRRIVVGVMRAHPNRENVETVLPSLAARVDEATFINNINVLAEVHVGGVLLTDTQTRTVNKHGSLVQLDIMGKVGGIIQQIFVTYNLDRDEATNAFSLNPANDGCDPVLAVRVRHLVVKGNSGIPVDLSKAKICRSACESGFSFYEKITPVAE